MNAINPLSFRKVVDCCSYISDGGRSSVAALQEEATNHRKVRRLRAEVLSVAGKRQDNDSVRYELGRRAKANPR